MGNLLTCQEVAKYLKLNPATVLRKAKKGELPAIKIGRQFRFDKDHIDRWLRHRMVGASAHILVVDDEPIIGRLFRDSLAKDGYQVTATLNSPEALELVAREHFDLIFLDLVMPQIDGSELFRRIREIDEHVPIAIITGYPDNDLMEKAMEQGPFLVMKKPFDSNDIVKAVRSFAQSTIARK